jgi:hypothetical protein
MAKDDYFVLVYQVLKYLYDCLKSGEFPDENKLSATYLGINGSYWVYIVKHLLDDKLIEDVIFGEALDGQYIIGLENVKITPEGITYLSENSMMNKVMSATKDLKDIIPGI